LYHVHHRILNVHGISGVSRGGLGGAQPPLPTLGPPLEKFETAVGEDVCPPYSGPERGRAPLANFSGYATTWNGNIRFNCSICNERIRREQMILHACSGDCTSVVLVLILNIQIQI
jgi:hypothetical protein